MPQGTAARDAVAAPWPGGSHGTAAEPHPQRSEHRRCRREGGRSPKWWRIRRSAGARRARCRSRQGAYLVVINLVDSSRAGGGSGRAFCMTRAQLMDAEWEFIAPYLPIGEFGPHPERLRQQFEGVIWRFGTGGQQREVPAGRPRPVRGERSVRRRAALRRTAILWVRQGAVVPTTYPCPTAGAARCRPEGGRSARRDARPRRPFDADGRLTRRAVAPRRTDGCHWVNRGSHFAW